MDLGRPSLALWVLAVASGTFVAVVVYTGMGLLSLLGCALMFAGFASAATARTQWLGTTGGSLVALGGLLFFVDNFSSPFVLGLSAVATLALVAGGVTLAYAIRREPAWIASAGAPFAIAGLLWIIADGSAGNSEWQLGNALVLLGGILLLMGLRRRRPPRPTATETPADASASPA